MRIVPICGNPDSSNAAAKSSQQKTEEMADCWRRHSEIVNEISRNWPEGVSTMDALNDVRRVL